ncbi:MAG: hypothetical protein U5K51_17060 [Flavobacteriaceae bacterium]|nr:hypothetical protein [Flavobacteriaceae bacterium]
MYDGEKEINLNKMKRRRRNERKGRGGRGDKKNRRGEVGEGRGSELTSKIIGWGA